MGTETEMDKKLKRNTKREQKRNPKTTWNCSDRTESSQTKGREKEREREKEDFPKKLSMEGAASENGSFFVLFQFIFGELSILDHLEAPSIVSQSGKPTCQPYL